LVYQYESTSVNTKSDYRCASWHRCRAPDSCGVGRTTRSPVPGATPRPN